MNEYILFHQIDHENLTNIKKSLFINQHNKFVSNISVQINPHIGQSNVVYWYNT